MSVRLALPLLVLALLAPASASARSVPQGFYGAVYDGAVTKAAPAVQDAQFAQMARAGVESVRTVFSWADAQPDQGGPTDFSATDQAVALAARHGMSLLPIVIYAPRWARADPSSSASPPASDADYVAYLQALVGRYGSAGTFWAAHPELPRSPIIYWQIWNEPHLRLYWDASNWQKGYGDLLRAAHSAVRQADPQARIVLAGLTGTSWTALASLYSKGGAKGNFDVAALQTYTGSATHLLEAVHLFRGVLSRHGDAALPLWLTEMGWPAAQKRIKVPSYQRTIATTKAGMAKRLIAGYKLLAHKRRAHNVRVSRVYWYTWASPYTPSKQKGTGIFRYAGLWRFNGKSFAKQPAYAAYVHMARAEEGCRKNAAARCR
jgi:hypothetical protein